MRVLVDADGCPVVDIAVDLCKKAAVECLLLCDTAHEFHKDGAATLIFDKGADSVDFALANRVRPGDIVITQDYGLASLCLARKATVLHQDGWEYTEWNIDTLLLQRHEARKHRAAGKHLKSVPKRTVAQDDTFRISLQKKLISQTRVQG